MNENDFQKRYSASSQKIKDFLISEELTETTKNIVALTKLDMNQTTQLTEMIGNVLLGQISPVNFSQEIESNLKVSPSQARIIIELAKKKIFEQFNKELEQYKPQPLKTVIPLPETPEETPHKKVLPGQISSEQTIPEYSFPEPSEIKVEKPVSKIGELKKVASPKVPPEQQEKIRKKLLEVMQKKDTQPKIVEEMKKVSLKKSTTKEIKEDQGPSRKKIIESPVPSEVLGGEGKKFQAEKGLSETKKEKPYILDVKLKEEEKKKEETPAPQEPIPYKKYQKKSPFGEA